MISGVAYTIRNTFFSKGAPSFRRRGAPVPWHSGTMASPRLNDSHFRIQIIYMLILYVYQHVIISLLMLVCLLERDMPNHLLKHVQDNGAVYP